MPILNEKDITKCTYLFNSIANDILSSEGKKFQLYDYQFDPLNYLLYYFLKDIRAETYFDSKKLDNKNSILLMGDFQTGKRLIMQTFSKFLHEVQSSNKFKYIFFSDLMQFYNKNNYFPEFTYSGTTHQHLCILNVRLNDTKHYGNSMIQIFEEFLFYRYEILKSHQIKTHLTTTHAPNQMQQLFSKQTIELLKSSYNTVRIIK